MNAVSAEVSRNVIDEDKHAVDVIVAEDQLALRHRPRRSKRALGI